MTARENTLVCRFKTPFNRKTFSEYMDDVRCIFPDLRKPWANLVVIEGAIPPIDTLEMIRSSELENEKAGRRAIVFVVDEQVVTNIIKYLTKSVMQGMKTEQMFFEDENSAWDWIRNWQKQQAAASPA